MIWSTIWVIFIINKSIESDGEERKGGRLKESNQYNYKYEKSWNLKMFERKNMLKNTREFHIFLCNWFFINRVGVYSSPMNPHGHCDNVFVLILQQFFFLCGMEEWSVCSLYVLYVCVCVTFKKKNNNNNNNKMDVVHNRIYRVFYLMFFFHFCKYDTRIVFLVDCC